LSTDDILNFVRVDDRVGTAGQPTAEQLADARDEGYQVVVNLAPADHQSALADEAAAVAALGMRYHHLPVPWTDPRPEHFRQFVEIMDEVAGKKVLVHCAANFRVTAFYSLYAMQREGWSVAQADELMAKVWGEPPTEHMDDAWRGFVTSVRSA
jgi:uncharacterized protein (TIGR01244 family)